MTEAGSSQNYSTEDVDRSKDVFYERVADVANAMIAAHGKEFAMGTLILAARFIAEGKALAKKPDETSSGTQFGSEPTPSQ